MNVFLAATNYIAGAIDMMQKNMNICSQQMAQVVITSSTSQVSKGSQYTRGHGRFGSHPGGRDNRSRGRRFSLRFIGRVVNFSTVTPSSTISTL